MPKDRARSLNLQKVIFQGSLKNNFNQMIAWNGITVLTPA